MHYGIQAGFSVPLPPQTLQVLGGLGFTTVRHALRMGDDIEAVVRSYHDLPSTPLLPIFLLERVQEMPPLAAHLKAALARAPLPHVAVEFGNEIDLAGVGWADYAECFFIAYTVLKPVAGLIPLLGSLSNLTRPALRQLALLLQRETWGAFPPEVQVALHRYPPASQGCLAPHQGFASREGEVAELTRIAGPRPYWVTEFGYHTARRPWRWGLSDQAVFSRIRYDYRLWRQAGAEGAVLYQLNDGPSADFRDHYGIRRRNGVWKLQASCLTGLT